MITDAKIRKLKPKDKPYKMTDSNGLYLEVSKTGKKTFRYRYRHPITKKEQTLTIGDYPAISLSDARQRRDDARELIQQGINPSEQKQRQKAEAQQEQVKKIITFAELFDRYADYKATPKGNKPPDWSQSNYRQLVMRMNKHVLPMLGSMDIEGVTVDDLERCLVQIEETTPSTIKKITPVLRGMFDYARVRRLVKVDISRLISPSIGAGYKSEPMKHLTTPAEIKTFLHQMDSLRATYEVKSCLILGLNIFVRPIELVSIEWSSVDFEAKQVHILHTKTKNPLIIPMSQQVRQLLKDMLEVTSGYRYVFQSPRGTGRHITTTSLRNALRRNEILEVVPHGFRHTASTALNNLGFDGDEVELQLNHVIKGVRGIYNKADRLPQRARMMQAWSDYLDGLKHGDNIIPLNIAKA